MNVTEMLTEIRSSSVIVECNHEYKQNSVHGPLVLNGHPRGMLVGTIYKSIPFFSAYVMFLPENPNYWVQDYIDEYGSEH